jgi:hypothetical protein
MSSSFELSVLSPAPWNILYVDMQNQKAFVGGCGTCTPHRIHVSLADKYDLNPDLVGNENFPEFYEKQIRPRLQSAHFHPTFNGREIVGSSEYSTQSGNYFDQYTHDIGVLLDQQFEAVMHKRENR